MGAKSEQPGATYDATTPSVIIKDLTITHPAVTTEALRWSSGSRGTPLAADAVDGADLTAYAEQALVVGAQAIAAAGGAQDTFNLEQLVQDVGNRTTDATRQATQATAKVVGEATKAVRDASIEAAKTLATANETTRKSFGDSVETATTQLHQ